MLEIHIYLKSLSNTFGTDSKAKFKKSPMWNAWAEFFLARSRTGVCLQQPGLFCTSVPLPPETRSRHFIQAVPISHHFWDLELGPRGKGAGTVTYNPVLKLLCPGEPSSREIYLCLLRKNN